MRTIILLSILSLPLAEARTKIAILNVQKAVLSTDEGKTAAAELQRKVAPEQARLSDAQGQIQNLETNCAIQPGAMIRR